MKKTYKIEVDCANCANKMEEAAKNTAGVKDANVNFMTLKMSVEFEEGQDPKAVMQDVLKNCTPCPFQKAKRFFHPMLVLFISQFSTVLPSLFSSEPPVLLPGSRVRSMRIRIPSPGSGELLLLFLLQRFP